MSEFDYEKMVKNVANAALDSFNYKGKSIREWIKIIAELDLPDNFDDLMNEERTINDIELVIKIPHETYRDVIKNGFIYDEDSEEISHVIINGTVLSKGHGDLIDRDAIDTSYSDPEVIEALNEAEVIIKADKEGRND